MIKLRQPNKSHKYVVGIDFGHAETSACICKIEWDIAAEKQTIDTRDIVLWENSNEKILVSAISKTADGDIRIHKAAFKYVNGNNCRIGFKEKPQSIDGESEQLMIAFMKDVYVRIRRAESDLTDDNHIVYIARPSGWQDEMSKDLYKRMAIQAGIKNLAGLTSESRAAIFYAKQPEINFHTDITKGALVFDLGSSTLDLTYLSKSAGPFDQGRNLGSSIIDEVIFEQMILTSSPRLKDFIQLHTEYIDPLKYEARKFKEAVYSAGPDDRSFLTISLKHILENIPNDIKNELKDFSEIKLQVNNADELNQLVDKHSNYRSKLCDFLAQFKTVKIKDNPIIGVLLVGGASKMYYLPDLISRTFNIPIKNVKRENDPNLIVSRGIALLGAKDAITSVLQKQLIDSLDRRISHNIQNETLKSELCDTIFNVIWEKLESSCKTWEKSDNGCDKVKLKNTIEFELLHKFSQNEIEKPCISVIRAMIKKSCIDIINDTNNTIAFYAPEVQISTKDLILTDILPENLLDEILRKDLIDLKKIADLISNSSLFNFIRHIFGNDDRSRKKMVDKIPKHKDFLRSVINQNMLDDSSIESVVSRIRKAIQNLILNKLHDVRIPIE